MIPFLDCFFILTHCPVFRVHYSVLINCSDSDVSNVLSFSVMTQNALLLFDDSLTKPWKSVVEV